jgi:hypothetical protein
MDPYDVLGITPAYEGDLRALRNRLVKRYFEAGETPDEERMKAINVAYELLSNGHERPTAAPVRPLSITTSALPAATAGEPYRAQLAVDGGVPPYTWEGALPAALTLSASGTIGGRLARTGSFPFTLGVADREGRTAQRVFVLHVAPPPLRVITRSLPDATVGVAYHAQLQVEGGVPPLRWSADPPAGLELGDGLLFGTPLGPGAAVPVEVRVHDAARQTLSASFPLVVREAELPHRGPDRAAIAAAILAAAAVVAALVYLSA